MLEGTLRDNILYGLRLPGRNGEWTIDHIEGRRRLSAPAGIKARGRAEHGRPCRERVPLRPGAPARPRRADGPCHADSGAAHRHPGEARGIRSRGRGRALRPGSLHQERDHRRESCCSACRSTTALAGARLASHALTRKVLDQCELTEPLIRMGRLIAATMLEIFSDLTPDHVLFEQFAFVSAEEFPEYREILARADDGDDRRGGWLPAARACSALCRAAPPAGTCSTPTSSSASLRRATPSTTRRRPPMADAIAFYDPLLYCSAAPLRDNLLFGLVAQGGHGLGACHRCHPRDPGRIRARPRSLLPGAWNSQPAMAGACCSRRRKPNWRWHAA